MTPPPDDSHREMPDPRASAPYAYGRVVVRNGRPRLSDLVPGLACAIAASIYDAGPCTIDECDCWTREAMRWTPDGTRGLTADIVIIDEVIGWDGS